MSLGRSAADRATCRRTSLSLVVKCFYSVMRYVSVYALSMRPGCRKFSFLFLLSFLLFFCTQDLLADTKVVSGEEQDGELSFEGEDEFKDGNQQVKKDFSQREDQLRLTNNGGKSQVFIRIEWNPVCRGVGRDYIAYDVTNSDKYLLLSLEEMLEDGSFRSLDTKEIPADRFFEGFNSILRFESSPDTRLIVLMMCSSDGQNESCGSLSPARNHFEYEKRSRSEIENPALYYVSPAILSKGQLVLFHRIVSESQSYEEIEEYLNARIGIELYHSVQAQALRKLSLELDSQPLKSANTYITMPMVGSTMATCLKEVSLSKLGQQTK